MPPGFSPSDARALGGPKWLVRRRVAAAEAFAAAAPPSTSAEEWRYSNVDELDLDAFAPANGPSPKTPSKAAHPHAQPAREAAVIAETLLSAVERPAAVVRCTNGHAVGIELSAAAASAGVRVEGAGGGDDDEALLGSLSSAGEDYFTLLNEAFAVEPLLVDVPSGVVLGGPVLVLHHSSGQGTACFPRLAVRLGANAEASVVDLQTSDGSQTLVSPVVELEACEAARLNYLNLQALGPRAIQIGSQFARGGRDSRISAATAAFGGASSRSRADTRLIGSGAHGDLIGVYFADRDQTLDFRTYQDHVAPHTTSSLLYKGVVADRSRSIYTGLIRIRPEAAGVEAFQTNRNLKLGDEAWAKSVPNLEIENNDVRCSHASAVSPVDEEQRFYLESRGVATPVAERLVVAGFLQEAIARLPVPSVRPLVRSNTEAKLDAATERAANGEAGRSALGASAVPGT